MLILYFFEKLLICKKIFNDVKNRNDAYICIFFLKKLSKHKMFLEKINCLPFLVQVNFNSQKHFWTVKSLRIYKIL